ncbi:hypothetical protein LCGC14_1059610 [marine sediment metagenome]|uniref:Uncharacterized protein n=1 Tax=marine sediment metagenome TaxID=412755 RepID=A0A0F9MR54_9ZZZZ
MILRAKESYSSPHRVISTTIIYPMYCLDCHQSFMSKKDPNEEKVQCKYCLSDNTAGPR